MSGLVGNFVSQLSSTVPSQQYRSGTGHPNVLSIHKSMLHVGAYDIVPYGLSHIQSPLYSVKTSKSEQPNVIVWKNNREVFTARVHLFSSKIDLVVHGQTMIISRGQLSEIFTIHHPTLGELKWRLSQMTGTSAELINGSGTKLARIKSNHVPGMGEKKLELLVPCDPLFLDLVVGSAMTVKSMLRGMSDNAGDVLGAIGDASGGGGF